MNIKHELKFIIILTLNLLLIVGYQNQDNYIKENGSFLPFWISVYDGKFLHIAEQYLP